MTVQTLAIVVLLVSFFVMIFLRFPIAYAVGLSSVLCMMVQGQALTDVCRLMVKGISSFSLMAVPFFITMGVLMGSGGISEKLIALADACVGWMRGGMAMVNIVASYFFGGISGSASADTASIGSIMIPTEQGRHFIRQAERVLDEVDRLDLDARSRQSSCAELRVVLPHATYASYATVDFLQQMADSQQLRVHIRESGTMEALDHVLRRGYHLALLRYAEEDEDYYRRYCDRHGLHREPVMEFEYRLLTNREGPLAKCEVTDITQLNSYMEVLHGDFQLPGGEDSGLRWHTNPNRRIHVYERCSQFSILQNLPNAYMWASPMPKRALEQYHLVLRKCPAQRQRMKDVLVYPDRGTLRPEEQTFVQLLHKQAALTVK